LEPWPVDLLNKVQIAINSSIAMDSITKFLLVLLASFSCLSAQAVQIIHLDKQTWRLQNANESVSLQTKLPAYPLEVLRANGVIQDPNYRSAEWEWRWKLMYCCLYCCVGCGDFLGPHHSF
jgi:hypothetical protein